MRDKRVILIGLISRLYLSRGDAFEGCRVFFSPRGRRWPEGSDEGATLPDFGELAPSSRCRDLLPGGEKKQAARTPLKSEDDGEEV